MTTETQIEVAFVNPPKPGAKSGSVKTKEGQFYSVFASDLGKFQPGGTYAIEYTEREGSGQWAGRTFRDIKSAKLVSNAPAAGTNGAAAGHNGSGGNQFRNPEQMFVEGLLTKAIENQTIHFTEESLTQSGLMLQTVWQRLWGGQ